MSFANASDPLLLQIYGGCTDTARWRLALDEVCAQTGAVSAVLQGLRIEGARAVPFWMAHDSYIDFDAYRATISDAGNPRLEAGRILKALTKSKPVQGDDGLFAPAEQPIRQRLNEQLLSMGLGHFVGALVPLDDQRCAALALHRRPGDTGDFPARVLDRLSELMPHLAQALSVSHAMALSQTAGALLQGHLDSFPCAMVVCDVRGQVHWLNQHAMTSLHAGSELQCPNRQLRAASGRTQQRLISALSKAADSRTQTFAAFDTADGRLHMAVQPLEAHANAADGLLLVTLTREDARGGRIPVEALKVLFDLTEAEARLAGALVAGSTVEQYATLRGVTVGTARYQLNQVLLKTGAHRQSDLVRRVLCCAAAHLAGRESGGSAAH